jgi:hypothetical protein
MFDEEKVAALYREFKRIFAMPITPSTYRELQNSVVTIGKGDNENANVFFESVLRGQVKDVEQNGQSESLRRLVEEFSIPTRVAKDVNERGEFLNLITSDTVPNPQQLVFLTRLRRIDGAEFRFVTDPDSILHLIQHFIGRFQEINRLDKSRKIIKGCKQELTNLKEKLEDLISQ